MNRLARTFSALAAVVTMSFVPVGALAVTGVASAAAVPRCSWSDLSLSLGVTLGGGGSMGTPVEIKNHGSTACAIKGFPKVTGFTVAKSPHPISFVDRVESQMYAVPTPKDVVIAPKGTASFGIAYVDVLGMQYRNDKGCEMTRIAVNLPGVTPVASFGGEALSLTNAIGIDFHYINACFTNFVFGLTPVVSGPTPPAQGATVHTCASTALSVKLGARGHGGAGSEGFAIAVTNKGAISCSLDGFATVTALTKTKSAKPITFVHTSRSQTYATASPKTVVLAPKGTASFGISFTDAADQQYGNATGCQMYAVNVRLPGAKPSRTTRISVASINGPLENYVNSCFTVFEFGLTPIVKGSTPPQP